MSLEKVEFMDLVIIKDMRVKEKWYHLCDNSSKDHEQVFILAILITSPQTCFFWNYKG
jgi:hypothetical protein